MKTQGSTRFFRLITLAILIVSLPFTLSGVTANSAVQSHPVGGNISLVKPLSFENGMSLASPATRLDAPPIYIPLISKGVVPPCPGDNLICATFTPGQPIKIGLGGPLSGGISIYGQDISQAAELAVADAGPFLGHSFELAAADDFGTPAGAEAVAHAFSADPNVVAISGHIFSGASMAVIPIYQAANLPMMSPSSTSPVLTTLGSQVFNRCVFTDEIQAKFSAQFLYNRLGLRKLAVLHDGQSYGQGIAQVVNNEFISLGGTVVDFLPITPGESDYSAVLTAVAAHNPDGLYYGGVANEAIVIVNQMATSGLDGVTFMGDDGVYSHSFLTQTGTNGEGAYAATLLPPSSDAQAAFDAAFLTAYGHPAGSLTPFTWSGYDSVAVLIQAIKSVAFIGSDGNLYIPRAALVAAVRGTLGYRGLTGTISCDATGECAASGPVFVQDVGGSWVQVP